MQAAKLTLLVVLAASLFGCYKWYHPTKGKSEFGEDKYTCERESAQTYPVVMQRQTYGAGYQAPSQTNCHTDYFGNTNCTTTPGAYTPPPSTTVDANQWNRMGAFTSCMESKGWSLQ